MKKLPDSTPLLMFRLDTYLIVYYPETQDTRGKLYSGRTLSSGPFSVQSYEAKAIPFCVN